MKRTRRLSSGKQWSARENEIVKILYPKYRKILRRLKGRSYGAVRNRARNLGIVKRRHVWTNREEALLRKLYAQGATRAEVSREFPLLTNSQVCAKARHIRLVRARKEPYRLGISPIDEVRRKAAKQGLTWRQLDKIAGTRRYFQQTTRRIDWVYLAKATEKLGGTIEITWQ
jgi:hypothetical protein